MNSQVLILNQNYQAIGVCSVQRAFVLVFLNKAETIHHIASKSLRSVSRSFEFPTVIRLNRYVNIPYKKVSLSRQNIYRRDGNCCVYCDSRDSLTLDHVLPRSRGGRDSWENLVTACQKCNTEKGDRTPDEAGMGMSHKPFRPSFIMHLRNYSGDIEESWGQFLFAG